MPASLPRYSKPVYGQQHNFYPALKERVKEKMAACNRSTYVETALRFYMLLLLFLLFYSALLLSGNSMAFLFIGYICIGIVTFMLFIGSMHDAAHDVLYRRKKWNRLALYGMELMGTNNYLWRKKHVSLHHLYPNVPGWDGDIEQADVVLLSPGQPRFAMHRWQHYYMPFAYFLYTLNWVLRRDFKDYFGKNRMVRKVVTIPVIEYYKLIAFKCLYLLYLLVVPMLVLPIPWYSVLGGFLCMHVTMSGLGLLPLLSAHLGEETPWFEIDSANCISHSWAYHQLASTNDVAVNNPVINFVYACFNHHVAHHLFPDVSRIHYPMITKVIADFAREHNLPYKRYGFFFAIRSHFIMLKRNAVDNNFFEETL